MQIWVIGRGIPAKENNMLGSFEFEQAQMLARHGYEVYYPIIDLRSLRHKRKIGFAHETIAGVNIETLNIPIGRALPAMIRNKLYEPLRKYQFRILGKKYGIPNIINVHYPSIYQYDVFDYLQVEGAKIIGTEHWSKVQNLDLPKANQDNLQDFVKKADAITCVGIKLKEAIIRITKTKRNIIIVPNIVSTVFYYKKTNSESHVFRFIAVGRLSKEKGYDKLVRAFCQSFGNSKNVHLHIVGGGEEYSKLNEIVLQNQAAEIITLHGVMQRYELSHFYHKCNVLIMPSDYETFGVPVIEAMSCGLPVITTKNAGVSNYVSPERGIVLENNEVESISEALIDIYNRYSQFDRQQISEFSNDHFSEDSVFEMINEIIERVAKGEVI